MKRVCVIFSLLSAVCYFFPISPVFLVIPFFFLSLILSLFVWWYVCVRGCALTSVCMYICAGPSASTMQGSVPQGGGGGGSWRVTHIAAGVGGGTAQSHFLCAGSWHSGRLRLRDSSAHSVRAAGTGLAFCAPFLSLFIYSPVYLRGGGRAVFTLFSRILV